VNFTHNNNKLALFGKQVPAIKEGRPLTKNGLIDFAQSWAIHMKKSNMAERKRGVASNFWAP
jgi:hypothetical protein